MKQKVEQELVDVLSNNSSDPNSGDVESLEVNEKALEEVFWYRLRNKTGRISAGLENIGQDLANGFKLIENEVEDVQWFSRKEVINFSHQNKFLPRKISIARRLIDDWINEV